MGKVKIILISLEGYLQTDLQKVFEREKMSAEVVTVATLEGLAEQLCAANSDAVIFDAACPEISLRDVMQAIHSSPHSCRTYTIFDELDEEAISSSINWGAASFALKNRLDPLAISIKKHLQEKAPLSVDKKYLQNSQNILRAFLEESTDSIWVKDKNGVYILINPAGARFLGKPIDQIIGKNDYDVFPFETAEKVRASDKAVMEGGVTQTIEDLLITLDGVNRTFQAVKGVFRDEAGNVQGVLGTVRDITLRKQAENALKQSEQRFRLLVEGVKDHAIYMLDPEGCITTWNIGAERLQGYSAEEIIGRHYSCFFNHEDITQGGPEQCIKEAMELGCHEREGWCVRKDGSKYWANVLLTPLYEENGGLLGFSYIVRDMTERKAAEEKLKYYAGKLKQSNRDLEEFAFIASHDLHAPLRKIKIFSEILQELAGKEGDDTAKRLQNTVTKMQQLISDLLALSRVNRRGRPLRKVDLNLILDEVLENLEPAIKESAASIKREELGMVYGDEVQLCQLFQNILSNSIKYRREGVLPEIKVKGEPLFNGFYQLTFQDNGIGFDNKFSEKVFLPFERLHSDKVYAGTGIGLAICKKIVDRHGGQISVHSEPGVGSTFTLYLPQKKQKPGIPSELTETETNVEMDSSFSDSGWTKL